MSQIQKYNILDPFRAVCTQCGLDGAHVTLRAGLPRDFLGAGARMVSGAEFMRLWDAVFEEAGDPGLFLKLAHAALEMSFDSAIYAFFSSPTVRIGLERKALFKPLIAPVRMVVEDSGDTVILRFGSGVAGRDLPAQMGWFDLVYFVLAIRKATAQPVIPVALQSPSLPANWPQAQALFGCPRMQAPDFALVLRQEDAALPLVSRNDALWAQVEAGLAARFDRSHAPRTLADRVRQALMDGLPGGQVTADQIARALALSKRSLQRQLRAEGVSFRDVLEDTRHALAVNYLRNSDMSVQEIAYLTGFRDPSSFFRAFRAWTGQTPHALRANRG